MNKDEILNKSRKENRNRDIFEDNVAARAQEIGGLIAAIAAFGLTVTELALNRGINYGYVTCLLLGGTGIWLVRAIRLRKKRDIIRAVIYAVLAAGAVWLYANSLGV